MLSGRIVLASANRGKLQELATLLAPLGLSVLAQTSLGVESAEETGDSFAANALLKARHASLVTGLPALADDSGIEVDALQGRPGVRSARYAGEQASDAENLNKLLHELHTVPAERRTARYQCVVALVRTASDPQPLLAHGTWEGFIVTAPRGEGGFGYDPIFQPRGCDCTAAQLTARQKNAVSHRAQALRELAKQLS
ncbi:MAG: RdgB/HAM1 family non-canonical purine NTP pyrophosphatase [Sinobacteraceae bacterium]|nr:RdgB/HAM1 family non-canonical purine NTP pyrophosphatase [Nevskiaceae bacterium]